MHLNGSSTPSAHTLGPQRAWRTHLHREAEDTATLATRTHIVAHLTGRTGATPGLEVKGKGRLREAALVSQCRYLGNERPPRIGEALPAGSKLWSKAGWTNEVRHDVAYIELPTGRKLILAILTRGTADDKTLLPAITKNILEELAPITPP